MWLYVGMAIAVIVVAVLLGFFFLFRTGKALLGNDSAQKRREVLGKQGEDAVAAMLQAIAAKHNGYAYENVAFKDENDYSSEIDAILICGGRFYVVEVKSNKGTIYGNPDDSYWHAKKGEWQEDTELKNPIKQNQGHINHLRRLLGEDVPYMTSIVIFPYANINNVRSSVVHDYYSAKEYILKEIALGEHRQKTTYLANERLKAMLANHRISHEEHVKLLRERYDA